MKVPIEADWKSPCTCRPRARRDGAGKLLGRRIVRDQVLEAGIDALEGGRLRVRDVAGDVFQRERLRFQSGHRGGECAKYTHTSLQPMRPDARRAAQGRKFG